MLFDIIGTNTSNWLGVINKTKQSYKVTPAYTQNIVQTNVTSATTAISWFEYLNEWLEEKFYIINKKNQSYKVTPHYYAIRRTASALFFDIK
jgi:hypothetical protein